MSNPKSATFVNATPHPINIVDANGNTHTLPASNNPIRLIETKSEKKADVWVGIVGGFNARVPAAEGGEVMSKNWENLPEKQPNVFYIVSLVCFQEAVRQEIDWLVGFDPERTIRDAKGIPAAQGGLLFVKKP